MYDEICSWRCRGCQSSVFCLGPTGVQPSGAQRLNQSSLKNRTLTAIYIYKKKKQSLTLIRPSCYLVVIIDVKLCMSQRFNVDLHAISMCTCLFYQPLVGRDVQLQFSPTVTTHLTRTRHGQLLTSLQTSKLFFRSHFFEL